MLEVAKPPSLFKRLNRMKVHKNAWLTCSRPSRWCAMSGGRQVDASRRHQEARAYRVSSYRATGNQGASSRWPAGRCCSWRSMTMRASPAGPCTGREGAQCVALPRGHYGVLRRPGLEMELLLSTGTAHVKALAVSHPGRDSIRQEAIS